MEKNFHLLTFFQTNERFIGERPQKNKRNKIIKKKKKTNKQKIYRKPLVTFVKGVPLLSNDLLAEFYRNM